MMNERPHRFLEIRIVNPESRRNVCKTNKVLELSSKVDQIRESNRKNLTNPLRATLAARFSSFMRSHEELTYCEIMI